MAILPAGSKRVGRPVAVDAARSAWLECHIHCIDKSAPKQLSRSFVPGIGMLFAIPSRKTLWRLSDGP